MPRPIRWASTPALRALRVPARLILAERSVIHPARDVESRTTHALSLQRPGLVTARIFEADRRVPG